MQADEALGKFLDYCTYGHMIDNVVLIVTGTLHERDVQVRATIRERPCSADTVSRTALVVAAQASAALSTCALLLLPSMHDPKVQPSRQFVAAMIMADTKPANWAARGCGRASGSDCDLLILMVHLLHDANRHPDASTAPPHATVAHRCSNFLSLLFTIGI